MSHKRRPEIDIGSDSFLDIIANIVGILIILIVVAGLRVSNASVAEVTPEPVEKPAPLKTIAKVEPPAIALPPVPAPLKPLPEPPKPEPTKTADPGLLSRIQQLKATIRSLNQTLETTNSRVAELTQAQSATVKMIRDARLSVQTSEMILVDSQLKLNALKS